MIRSTIDVAAGTLLPGDTVDVPPGSPRRPAYPPVGGASSCLQVDTHPTGVHDMRTSNREGPR